MSAVSIEGAEFELKFQYKDYFLNIFRFTQIDAIDDGDIPYYKNNRIPFQPVHAVEYYIESGYKKLRIFTNMHWLGSLYRDRANSHSNFVDSRVRYDIGAIYYFNDSKKDRLSLIVKNISDEYHSDIVGYPLPSRTYEIEFYKGNKFMKRM